MTDYEKLKSIIAEAEGLVKRQITAGNVDFLTWHNKTLGFLIKKYGEKSFEYKAFDQINFQPIIYTNNAQESVGFCKRGLTRSIGILKNYLAEFDEEIYKSPQKLENLSQVFVVHGHDGELKESVARFLEKLNIEAIILSEQANQGKTIIEKLEKYSDVGGAICLFTADDNCDINDKKKARARQNVVLETGYFMGKLGREKVIILADKDVELPSDLGGIVYTNKDNWQIQTAQELKSMGFKIDFNKIL